MFYAIHFLCEFFLVFFFAFINHLLVFFRIASGMILIGTQKTSFINIDAQQTVYYVILL